MHAFLTKFRVPESIQEFFQPHFTTDNTGNLLFSYGGTYEHFGFAFHFIPYTDCWWMAGNLRFPEVKQVIICPSAMEAIAFLTVKAHAFPLPGQLLFLAAGQAVTSDHIRWVRTYLPGRSFALVFGKDLLGQVTGIKIAAGIRKMPVAITLLSDSRVRIRFRYKDYNFKTGELSLNAFENATGLRTGLRSFQSKTHETFLAQLM